VIAKGQQHSDDDKKIVDSARSRYYSLEQRGLNSFQCSVQFDIGTIPAPLLAQENIADRKLLQSSSFNVKYERKGATVTHSYPNGTTTIAEASVSNVVNWMTSIVTGFFLTWPTKGFNGPIPPFDSLIDKISPTPNGYEFILNVSGGPVIVEMDKKFLVTRVVSIHGMVDEKPIFTETPDGLVYSGTHTFNENPQGDKTDIRIDIDSADVEGLRLPSSVRLRVNDNVDVRFSLSGCSVEKGTVVRVDPPKKN
jgi:hypothetical protein